MQFSIERLDHGVLNIPLNKRGNIDAQIDSFKKEEKKQRAIKLDEIKENYKCDRERAEILFKSYKKELYDKFTLKYGKNELNITFNDLLKHQPKKLILLIEKFIKENNTGIN